MKERRGWTL